MRKIAILTATLLLAGCGSMSVPASGTTSKGEKFFGQATASASEGSFQVMNAAGTMCKGTYDQWSRARELDVTFNCTDGRTGAAKIVRNPNLMGGKGSGTMSDGSTIDFIFGRDSGA